MAATLGVFGDFLMSRALQSKDPADLIIHHASVITVDPKFRVFEAIAAKDGRVLALGDDETIFKLRGPKTTVIDANGNSLLPGLYDSHVHPVSAALSELGGPLPILNSLRDVFSYIRKQAATTPRGEWIVVRYAFPTRLVEGRFPTRAELDVAAPDHPVLYHAGPAGVANSAALKLSGVTKDTPSPPAGTIVTDPTTGQPTGMLRNA